MTTVNIPSTIARLGELNAGRTKGEWSYEYRERKDGMYAGEVFDEQGQTIATMNWHAVETNPGTLTTDREENGNYIAAMPQAFTALQEADKLIKELVGALSTYDDAWEYNESESGMMDRMATASQKAKAALSLARSKGYE